MLFKSFGTVQSKHAHDTGRLCQLAKGFEIRRFRFEILCFFALSRGFQLGIMHSTNHCLCCGEYRRVYQECLVHLVRWVL